MRPGLQRLLADAQRGSFDVVVAEALDRVSRDQEDIAGFFKRLRFAGVRLATCSEGEINELHVGLKGTMNALFLKDLAAKTHRGLEGRIRKGMSAGGITFGYDIVKGDGDAGRGARTVNPTEAAVVVRVFQEFAASVSPNAIVRKLNAEKVPGPGGRFWLDTTIRGHALRGTGILRNELYIGKLVWNRLRYVKDPVSGLRRSRLNPRTEWVTENVPHLRIVDDELWLSVASRLNAIRNDPMVLKRIAARPVELRRPAHFTTGRVICGACNKPMARIGKDYLGCNFARRRGTCTNKATVRQGAIEAVVIEGLKGQLMAPDLVREFVDAFHKELNKHRAEEATLRSGATRELHVVETKIGKLVDAIASGIRTRSIVDALETAEARKVELEKLVAQRGPPPIRLHPALADRYRVRVAELHNALKNPNLETEATQIIRSLIDRIVVTNGPSGTELELVGDLAMMVRLGSDPERRKAAHDRAALSLTEQRSVKVVAGAGFEPTTFRL